MQCSNFFQKPHAVNKMHSLEPRDRAETKALIEGGGCIFIYSCSARRISFEITCNDN